MKKNCWDVKNCGRENGNCPAVEETRLNGVHGGKNAGRACWVVAGTLCSSIIQGSFALMYFNCKECSFFQSVKNEEGENFISASTLLEKLK